MMTKVKSLLFALAALAIPILFTSAALFAKIDTAWNFGYFSSVLLAIFLWASVFSEAHDQSELKNSYGRQRRTLLDKAKKKVDKFNACTFKGRGLIIALPFLALVALLVYGGCLVLAGFILIGWLFISAAMTATLKQYEELKHLGAQAQSEATATATSSGKAAA